MDDISDIVCQDAGSELVLLGALVALSIGHNLSSYEQDLFGTFLQVVGQNLSIMSVKKEKCKNDLINLENGKMSVDATNNILNKKLDNE